MKGKGIGRFFADIKEKLRAVSKRDRLYFKPETKESEMALQDLEELQEKITKAEKELESAKTELAALERVDTSTMTPEVLNVHLSRVKELKENIPKLEEDIKRYKKSEVITHAKETFEVERKAFVKEFSELNVVIPTLIEDILNAFKTENPKTIRNANRKLEEQLKALKRLSYDAAERSAVYTRALGVPTTIVLPEYRLTEERVRELYVIASKGEEKYMDNASLSSQFSNFIVLLESLAPEGFDFDKMRVEEDRKIEDKIEIEDLNKEIEELMEDMKQMRAVLLTDPDLPAKYDAMKAKLDAFIAKYKGSELIEVDYSPIVPNVIATTSVKAGVHTIFTKYVTDEQMAKITSLRKAPETRTTGIKRPLRDVPVIGEDGLPHKLELKDVNPVDYAEYIADLNRDTAEINRKIEEVKAIPADDPELISRFDRLLTDINLYRQKHITCYGADISYDVKKYQLTVKPELKGVKDLDVKVLTPEQIVAYEKSLTDGKKGPTLEPPKNDKPLRRIKISDDMTIIQRLEDINPKDYPEYIAELNKDIQDIYDKILVIRSIPAANPLLVDMVDRLEKDIKDFRIKHKPYFGANITYEDFFLRVKPELAGVNVLNVETLLPAQRVAYEKAKGKGAPDPTKGGPATDPTKGGPATDPTFGERVQIEEINKDVNIISQRIRVIKAIPPESPLLVQYYERLKGDIIAFAEKYKTSPLVKIAYSEEGYKLTVIPLKTGVNSLDVNVLTPNQIVEYGKAKAVPDPTKGGPATDPTKGGPATDPTKGGPATDPTKGGPATDPTKGGPATDPTKGGPATDPTKGGPATDPKADEKKAFRDKYIAFVQTINTKIQLINHNNELLSRMVTYNPDEMELEIATEKDTYVLERGLLNDQLELANMRLEYFKKYGQFILSDPEVLATKLEESKFESSKDLDAFVNARNVKIIEAENEIIDLTTKIEELKAAAAPGYETKVNEAEQRIKLFQQYIRTQNSIVQRRLAAEGKSIDIAAYFIKRNEQMKELRAKMTKGAPDPTKGGPATDPTKDEPTEEEKKTMEGLLAVRYSAMVNDIIKRVLNGEEVSLKLEKISEPELEKYKEINEKVYAKYAAILDQRVEKEQLNSIRFVYQQLADFYKKTVAEKRIPTKEEVEEFIKNIDKQGLNCEIKYDLEKNRFSFTYTHKELDIKTTRAEEVTRTDQRICIYDKKLHAAKLATPRDVGVGQVKYSRRELAFSPKTKAQKVDTGAASLISDLSQIEVVRVKNKLKIMYTESIKNKLEALKANIKILNTKSKGSKASYDVKLGDKMNADGKYESNVTLKGHADTDNYSMVVGFDIDGKPAEVQFDLEEKTRSR